jgi:signal transduction histidine kinase
MVEPRASYLLRSEDGRGVPPLPDNFFNAAVAIYAAKLDKSEIVQSDIKIKRKTLVPRDRNDPRLAASEGLVERICLPLVLGRELLWVLDLRWEVSSPQSQGAQDHLGHKYLWLLGDDLSKFSRLHIQTRKRVEAEDVASRHLKSQHGLLGKVSVMAQHAHEWRNQIIELKGVARDIKEIEDMEERGRAVDELLSNLEAFAGDVDNMLKLTEGTSLLAQPFYLCELIETQGETRIASKKHKREIDCRIDIPKEMRVHVTPRSMKLAFQNIIDNAVKATKNCPDALLSIRAAPDKKNGHVTVYFTNNGKQMAPEFRDAINEERYEDLKTQWGLIIAKSFAQYDNGDLTVLTPDSGETVLIFTLPVASLSQEEARWI